MRTLKLVLAWLDWSTYCNDFDYTFPKSICPLFWRTLFAIIILPLTWFIHIINAYKSYDDFKRESDNNKLTFVGGVSLHLVFLLSGGLLHSLIDKEMGFDIYHVADGYFINYVKLFFGGILLGGVVLLIIAILIGIVMVCREGTLMLYRCSTTKRKTNDGDGTYIPRKPFMVKRIYSAIKDKYCPRIDWSDIKKK